MGSWWQGDKTVLSVVLNEHVQYFHLLLTSQPSSLSVLMRTSHHWYVYNLDQSYGARARAISCHFLNIMPQTLELVLWIKHINIFFFVGPVTAWERVVDDVI